MPLDDQQKRQAVILFLLVGVLGIVFYFMDPLGLFKKDSKIPPEVQKKLDEQAKLASSNTPNNSTPDKPVDPKTDVKKIKRVNIKNTTMNYDELIPEVYQLEIINQFDIKTQYKADIFIDMSGSGEIITKAPPIKISSYSSSNGVNKVQFSNVLSAEGKADNRFYVKGDEFYFSRIKYRILDIDISYDSETRSQVRVKIMDVGGKETDLSEHTLYYPNR